VQSSLARWIADREPVAADGWANTVSDFQVTFNCVAPCAQGLNLAVEERVSVSAVCLDMVNRLSGSDDGRISSQTSGTERELH